MPRGLLIWTSRPSSGIEKVVLSVRVEMLVPTSEGAKLVKSVGAGSGGERDCEVRPIVGGD